MMHAVKELFATIFKSHHCHDGTIRAVEEKLAPVRQEFDNAHSRLDDVISDVLKRHDRVNRINDGRKRNDAKKPHN